jgi:hypothetical protein
MMTAQVSTEFPGGSGSEFEWLSGDLLRFTAERHGAPYALWFHFRLDDPPAGPVRCSLANAAECLGWPFTGEVRPVYRSAGGQWQRCPRAEVDAEQWSFPVPTEAGQPVEVALCYPYQVADWEAWLEHVFYPAGGTVQVLGETAEGRPYHLYRAGEGPQQIWLMSRTHAGEVPGSFTLEGVAADLLTSPNEFSLHLVPFVDLDGVIKGAYGKCTPPLDFYEAWREKVFRRPEINALQRYVEEQELRPAVVLDLHAPIPSEPHYFDATTTAGLDPETAARVDLLSGELLRHTGKSPDTRLDPSRCLAHQQWFTAGFRGSPAGYFQQERGSAALTIESAYSVTLEGVEVGPDSWRRLGRELAQGVRAFLARHS